MAASAIVLKGLGSALLLTRGYGPADATGESWVFPRLARLATRHLARLGLAPTRVVASTIAGRFGRTSKV